MRVLILDSAEEDTEEAVAYYDAVSEKLGAAFLEELNKAIDWIKRFPFACARIRKSFRIRQLKRFRRFGVLYKIRKPLIAVYGVVNLQRGPGFWKRRLG
jgi:hypothetical protein